MGTQRRRTDMRPAKASHLARQQEQARRRITKRIRARKLVKGIGATAAIDLVVLHEAATTEGE